MFGRFNPVCYGVAAFVSYSDVCVAEYISDLACLWGYVHECCPFLVFSVTWCGDKRSNRHKKSVIDVGSSEALSPPINVLIISLSIFVRITSSVPPRSFLTKIQ